MAPQERRPEQEGGRSSTLDVSLISFDLVVYVQNVCAVQEKMLRELLRGVTALHRGSGDFSAENRSVQNALEDGIEAMCSRLQVPQDVVRRASVTSEIMAAGLMGQVNR